MDAQYSRPNSRDSLPFPRLLTYPTVPIAGEETWWRRNGGNFTQTRSKVVLAPFFCPVFCPVFFCTGPDKANTGENRRRFGDLFSPVFARYFRSRRPAKLVKRGGRQRHRPSIRPPPPLKSRRSAGDLVYTLEEVAVPADAAGDASSMHIFCSSAALFCSFVDTIEAYEIEIGWTPRPE